MLITVGPLVRVRTMSGSDVRFAAALHRECLPHGLFPSLGGRFLRRYLFTFATSPFGVALIVEVDDKPAGFLVGSFDESGHRSHVVRQHGTPLAMSGIVALACRPPVAWRFVRTRLIRYVLGFTRRKLAPVSGSRDLAPQPRVAVLAHVAVVPSLRGAGAGRALVDRFVQRARATEACRAELLTRDGEVGAASFYASLGWDHEGHIVDRDGLQWTKFATGLE